MTSKVQAIAAAGRPRARHAWRIGAAVLVAAGVAVFILLVRPAAPRGLENGSFVNDCCGSLRLHDGAMTLNDKSVVRYTVGHDGGGAYILPRAYVGGFEEIGFEVDGSRPAVRLRLDRLPYPRTVLVPGGRVTYRFRRRPA